MAHMQTALLVLTVLAASPSPATSPESAFQAGVASAPELTLYVSVDSEAQRQLLASLYREVEPAHRHAHDRSPVAATAASAIAMQLAMRGVPFRRQRWRPRLSSRPCEADQLAHRSPDDGPGVDARQRANPLSPWSPS